MREALNQAIREEMARDENVIALGEDIGTMGSPFGVMKGLLDEFGDKRIIETPISEEGFTGMAVGAAVRGMRPIVEFMYVDFTSVAMDPIMNQAAKMRYMTGGQVNVPMVIRAPSGAGRRTAGQHTQSFESMFMNIPGLKVVSPSTPKDAKGLLKSAIRDNDPVMFMEQLLMYNDKGEVPDEEYTIPLGKADIKRAGKDVTILTWSLPTHFSLAAAEILAKDGIDVEVVDLRTIVPLDWETIVESVKKTNRVVIVEYGVKRGGVGAELSAKLTEELFYELDAPIVRLASANVVTPYCPALEDHIRPNRDKVVEAIREMMK